MDIHKTEMKLIFGQPKEGLFHNRLNYRSHNAKVNSILRHCFLNLPQLLTSSNLKRRPEGRLLYLSAEK